MARNYRAEYDRYQGTTVQKKRRAMRNKARRQALREGRVHKGDDMEVDHIRPLRSGGSNAKSNQRVISRKRNRGWKDGV